MGKKREQASFTFNPKAFSVGHHLDWGDDQNDDAPLLMLGIPATYVSSWSGHVPGLTMHSGHAKGT
jgi:hypothetical protein